MFVVLENYIEESSPIYNCEGIINNWEKEIQELLVCKGATFGRANMATMPKMDFRFPTVKK